MNEIRDSLHLIQHGDTDPEIRRAEFEASHPDVTILAPAALHVPWRAIVPIGSIPRDPLGMFVTDWDLTALMDKLDNLSETS